MLSGDSATALLIVILFLPVTVCGELVRYLWGVRVDTLIVILGHQESQEWAESTKSVVFVLSIASHPTHEEDGSYLGSGNPSEFTLSVR